MGKRRARSIVGLAVMLGCCTCAFALDPSLDVSQYAHTAWRVRDGFAKGFIHAIAQTPDGYLWLGTEFGLLRFDGVRAVAWTPPRGQLPSNNIPTLLVTHDGTFWIGTTKGLASWKDGKLTTYSELNGSRISALLEDGTGTVWIATDEPRIFGENVGPINADSEGKFWVGLEKGSGKWKSGQPESFEMPGAVYGLPPLGEHEKSALLTSSDRRVPGPVNSQVRWPKASQVLRDRDGGLWVGTPDRGLIHFHQGRTDVFSEADGLSGDTVTALLEDQEGNIWAVTTNGIDRFREYAVPNISIKQGLSNTNSVSIVGAKDGGVWVATYNGLNRWKDGRIGVLLRPGSSQQSGAPKGVPYSLFEDSGGRLWFSTVLEFGYLRDGRFVPVREVPGGRVVSMAEAPSGHLWLAKQDYGLFHLFQGRVVEKIRWAALGHNDHARVVVADPSWHGVWLGFSGGGVSYFADGAIRKSYSAAHGLGAGRVNSLRFGPRGALWVATENGLSRIKNDHVTTLTSKNGLPCDTVHWSMDDTDHFVWVFTACGLVRIPRPELDAWVDDPSKSVQTSLLDVSDGVRTHSYVSAVQNVTKTSDGRIWYVASDGVSVIDPHRLSFNNLPPPVHIEQITADGQTYDASQGMRLPPLLRNLTIDYTALSFVAPEKVHFRFMLEGQDKDWREVVNDRRVEYSNLAPGHYRFRVMACNNSGVWNEEGALLDFSIAPAFYQTNWFRSLCVVVFLTLLWSGYQLRVRQLRRQEKRLRDVIEGIPTMAFAVHPDGSPDLVNRRWLDYTGLSGDGTAGGRGWEATIHPDDAEAHLDKWRAALSSGEPFESEARHRSAGGEYRWFLVRAVPFRDRHGRIVKWYGSLTDIEESKRAEDALRRSGRHLAEAQKLSQTGSFAYDAKTNTFPYWSEEHFRIWGFDPQQNPPDGDTLLQRVHVEDRVMVRQRLEKALRQRKDYTAEFRIVLPDGTVKYIEAIGHHLSTVRGEPVELVGTHVDVTARKRADEERERLRHLEAELAHINRVSMLGELTASLAHEINQPIAAAITSAGACLRWLNRERPEVQRAREAVMRIENDGRRAADIISRVKTFYKKDASLQREPVAVNEVIGEMLVLLRSEADRHSVVMRTELASDLPAVRADRVQLQQVLMNLMLNGIEAMRQAGGELKVRTRREGGEVLVSVSDTGEGIPADKMEQIFNAFFTTKDGGTGMGLAISSTIIESHGGRLWAEANQGRGAAFHFTLPTQPEAQQ